MKNLIKLILVVGIIALILSSGSIYEALFGKTGESETLGKYNERFQYIEKSIDTLAMNEWDVKAYKKVRSSIKSSESSELIDEDEADALKKSLDLSYIPLLLDEAKRFFNGKCDDRQLLVKINSEFNRYLRVDKEFRDHFVSIKKAILGLYNIAGYQRNDEDFRRGLDGRIERYVKGNFILDVSQSYADSLDMLIKYDYVRKCPMAQKSYRTNLKRLDDHYFKDLKYRVVDYVEHYGYSEDMYKGYVKAIDTYKERNFGRIPDELNKRCKELTDKLYKHRVDNKPRRKS